MRSSLQVYGSMGQIELSYVLMLNWIVWNRAVYCLKMDLASNTH